MKTLAPSAVTLTLFALILIPIGCSKASVLPPIRPLVFSDDGHHVMWIARKETKYCVVKDMTDGGPQYDDIGDLSLQFDRSGGRTAYSVKVADKWHQVIDSQLGPAYDSIGEGSFQFSDDGRRIAYCARKGSKWFAVVDGVEGSPYDGIDTDTPIFSADSKHVAYVARKGDKRLVVSDGEEGSAYSDISDATLHFNSAAQTVYEVKKGDAHYLVINGTEGPIGSFTFHDAFAARQNAKAPNGWKRYFNPMAQFSIDCPKDWVVTEMDRLNGVMLKTANLTLQVHGFVKTSKGPIDSLEGILYGHTNNFVNSHLTRTNAGLAEAILVNGQFKDGRSSFVLVAQSGDCGYLLESEIDGNASLPFAADTQKVVASFRVLRSIAAEDFNSFLIRHQKFPGE